MDPTIIPEPLNIPESLVISKRPRNKRKNKENIESSKTQYHLPRHAPRELEHSMDQDEEESVVAEPRNKRQRRENKESSKHQYHLLKQVPKEMELPMDQDKEDDLVIEETNNNTLNSESTTDQLR